MIPVDPNLPLGATTPWEKNLTWKLTQILRDMAKEINKTSGSSWDGMHPILGNYHIWVDATGDVRIKSSVPTSDTDGTVVGTQT